MALLTELYSTTRQNRSRELADNLIAHNALLYWLSEKCKIKDDGGRDIGEPLIHTGYDAETVKFFDGYDTFTVDTAQEVITEAVYDWKELGGFTFISKKEERQNRGVHAAVKLLSAKRQALISTLKNTAETALAGDGTTFGGKSFGGLPLLVADDPTAAGTVGGIDQVANTWWRNQTNLAAAALSASNIQGKMNTLWLATTFNNEMPDFILAGTLAFQAYWESLQTNARYIDAKRADAGFKTLEYVGQPVFYVSSILNDRMYFLNSDYLAFRCNGPLFEEQDEQVVQGGFYTLFPNYTMANLTTNNRSRHGVLGDST